MCLLLNKKKLLNIKNGFQNENQDENKKTTQTSLAKSCDAYGKKRFTAGKIDNNILKAL